MNYDQGTLEQVNILQGDNKVEKLFKGKLRCCAMKGAGENGTGRSIGVILEIRTVRKDSFMAFLMIA